VAVPEHAAQLSAWRTQLVRAGLSTHQVLELEDHLITVLEALSLSGVPPDDAWNEALLSLGDDARLATEYTKLNPAMTLCSKLAGVLISLGLFAFIAAMGSSMSVFVHIPSLLAVAALVGGGLIASFGPLQVSRALRAGLGHERVLEPAEVETYTQVAARGYRLSWVSGVIVSLASIIQVLTSLGDPTQLGAAAGLGLLSLLYGALLAELLFGNLRHWVLARGMQGGSRRELFLVDDEQARSDAREQAHA